MKQIARHLLLFTAFLGFSIVVFAQTERGPRVSKIDSQAVGQTWALVIGVSQYQNISSLQFASADAEAFYSYLTSPAGGSVPQSNIQLLINDKATVGQIDRALRNLLDMVKPNDRVFFYFSGHGDQESKTIAQRGFLLTYNASGGNYNSTAFPVLFLNDYITTLSTINKAQIFLFLDACRAGKLAGSEIGGVQLLGQQLLAKASNEVKFMACQANELSLEGPKWGGGRGLFSYHLIRGMQGLADSNQDKQITLRELERYIEDHVTPEAMPNRQNPLLIADDKSIPIFKVDPPTLKALQNDLPLPTFVAVQGKGFSEKILDANSDEVQGWYADFQKAIAQKRLMFAPNDAESYLDRLLAINTITDLHPFIKREFATALLEESTLFFGKYLKDLQIDNSNNNFQRNVRYLEKASEILGKSHHFYPNLHAQIAYYKGLMALPAKTDEAVLNFREAIASDSAFSPAYNSLGVLLYQKKTYQEAQNIFEKGLIHAPTWSFLYLNYGRVLVELHRWEEAEKAYKKSIELKPDDAVAYKNYGSLLALQNRTTEAEAAYKKSIELKADDPSTFLYYGILLNTEKRYVEAEAAYKKAIELNPNNAQIYYNYGIVLANQNRQAEAEAAFQKSIQLDPQDAQVYFEYGLLLINQNRQTEAENNFKKSIELNPNEAIVYNAYGVLLTDQKRITEAENAYKKCIELNPKIVLVYANYANLLYNQNRLSEAELFYKKSTELDPGRAKVLQNYGTLLTRINRLNEAETIYKHAIQLSTDDAGLYRSYGNLLMKLKRPDDAEEAYKKSIDLSPNDARVFDNYGRLLGDKGRLAEAEDAFKKSIALDSTLGFAYMDYGNLLGRQKRFEEAEKHYKKAIQLIADDAGLFNNYGYVLEMLKRDNDAVDAYKKSIEIKNNNPIVYYYIACIKARQNLPTEALDWLRKAIEKNFRDFDKIARSDEWNAILEMPEFKKLLEPYQRK